MVTGLVARRSCLVDGVRRGLHEAVKSLAKATKGPDGAVPAGGARLAILAHDCDEASYAKVVKALAAEKGVPLIEIPLAITLGEWCVTSGQGRGATTCALVTVYLPPPTVVAYPPRHPLSPLPPTTRRCGLCKIDREGKPRKVVSTSCAMITDFGESSRELEILLNHLKSAE